MDTIQCFRYDQWLTLPPAELEPGDQFVHQGQLAIVTAKPSQVDGAWQVPAERPEPSPIRVDLSYGILAQVMDYAGTGLKVFQDGTAILADLTWAPGFVYSPRLPKAELEAFCEAHLDRYKAFYDANEDAIIQGKSVVMTAWWNDA